MKRPIKIVRLITRLNIGGPSIHAVTLSAELPRDEFTTTLACGETGPAEGDMTRLAEERGIAPVRIRALARPVRPARDLKALSEVSRLLERERPDILHTHMSKAGALGRIAAIRLGGIKTVHTFHGHVLSGYFSRITSGLLLRFERALARRTDRLVAISQSQRDDLLNRYRIGDASRYAVIPLGFDLKAFEAADGARGKLRAELGIAPEAPVVSIVGRLVPVKDHRLFLDAARRILAARKDALFLIVGDGPLRETLEARAREGGLSGSVRFLGWRRDLVNIYADSDLVLLTSINEGTPVSLIEAAAAGRAVVAAKVGGVGDVVREGGSGLLAETRDPAEIAGLALRLLGDRGLAAEMGLRGREFVSRRYTKARLLDDVARLYREVMAENK